MGQRQKLKMGGYTGFTGGRRKAGFQVCIQYASLHNVDKELNDATPPAELTYIHLSKITETLQPSKIIIISFLILPV